MCDDNFHLACDSTARACSDEEEADRQDLQGEELSASETLRVDTSLYALLLQGSIFAEFKEKDKAESFLSLPTIQFKGKELIKESK